MKKIKILLLNIILICCNSAGLYAKDDKVQNDNDVYLKFQEYKKQIMDEFLSDSKSFMNDVDDNLFKSFGMGADLSGNLFKSRWQDTKSGRSFLITPEKNVELKITVSDGFISIVATEKNASLLSTSKVSLNVPEDLDWKKHTITKKGADIVVSFPYFKGSNPSHAQYKIDTRDKIFKQKNVKKEKTADEEEETVPIIPNQNYDVI